MLILLLGPSGAGKTSIIQVLDERNGWRVIPSYITRPVRQLDKYKHTVSEAEYRTLLNQNKLFSHVEQFQYMYGTLRDDVELAQQSSEPWLLDFDVHTYKKVFEGTRHLAFVILPGSTGQLVQQLTAIGRPERIVNALEQITQIENDTLTGHLGLNAAIFVTCMPAKINEAAATIATTVAKAIAPSKIL